jgi:dihydrodipicolinate synthase/N-acetylneuraminate lyase
MCIMIQGVIPALMTPFNTGGREVDVPALKRLCDHLIAVKVSGLFVTGTTAEFVSLSPDERRLVIREVLRYVGDQLTVIVHVGSYNTEEATSLTRFASEHGAKAVGAMPPYFYTLDDDAIFTHFSRICESANELPVYLYNIPGCATNSISLDNVRRLKESYPHVAGIKESSGDMEREQAMLDMKLPDFNVINGCDEKTLTGLRMGVRASVSSTANAFPEAFYAVYEAFEAGDTAKAESAQQALLNLTNLLGNGRLLAAYKQALAWRGVEIGTVRPPHRELTPDERERLKTALTDNGWI